MHLLTVAPITRGALKGALTYFSKDPLAIGSVIFVPIQKREVPALVLNIQEVANAKSAIRSSDYALRKITHAKPLLVWGGAFLKATDATADFHAQGIGETLLALTPKAILDAHIEGALQEPRPVEPKNKFEILAIQSDTKTRLASYQRFVRESFVHHESVFICLPTEDDVERVAEELGHGIEDYTFVFHSSVSKKRILERWQKAISEKHAVLVVGTAQYLGLPRHFKTIVLDEEHSHAWRMMVRPLIDLRIFIENYARANKSTLIIGSAILRAETQGRIAMGAIGAFGRITAHTLGHARTTIIDPRSEEKAVRENTGKRDMILLTKELRELIATAREQKEHVFLLVARKGLAPVTACGDCGILIRCPLCESPLVIHRVRGSTPLRNPRPLSPEHPTNSSDGGRVAASNATRDKHIFSCHGCGFTRIPEDTVHETCPQCKGWRLQGIGIGIDRIEEEISALFSDTPLFVLDGDRTKTRTQAKKIIAQFEKSAGGILVATPMAIPLINTVEHTAIISIDSLFAIPDIRMYERIFALILALREKTRQTLLLQTRANDTALFEQALQGDLAGFTKNELSLRRAFSYPPYGTIIKITLRGKRTDLPSEMERLKTFLTTYAPIVPGTMAREPARAMHAGGPKNIFRMHMILKLGADKWPENQLLAKLRALPPQFTIEVNPDHLL